MRYRETVRACNHETLDKMRYRETVRASNYETLDKMRYRETLPKVLPAFEPKVKTPEIRFPAHPYFHQSTYDNSASYKVDESDLLGIVLS
nr:G-protein coupled receptor 139 [Biomphalaria glabrata]